MVLKPEHPWIKRSVPTGRCQKSATRQSSPGRSLKNPQYKERYLPYLKTQFEPKLELARIKGRSWPTVVASVAGSLFEEIEALSNELKARSLVNSNHPAQTHVQRHEAMSDARIATKTA